MQRGWEKREPSPHTSRLTTPRVTDAGPARKPVVPESMDGPASPAADGQDAQRFESTGRSSAVAALEPVRRRVTMLPFRSAVPSLC
jgi:hypothetical protein